MPTYTDNLETIRRMCGWIAKELGPDQPLHFSRFQPQHKLSHLTPTPVQTLLKARDAAGDGWSWRAIGEVAVRRKSAPVELFTPESPH